MMFANKKLIPGLTYCTKCGEQINECECKWKNELIQEFIEDLKAIEEYRKMPNHFNIITLIKIKIEKWEKRR